MNTINIDDLTIAQVRQIHGMLGPGSQVAVPESKIPSSAPHPFKIGANYFIRTVTMSHTGRLVEVTSTELVLEDAAWIADTGRFSQALKTSSFDEVEPFPTGRVIIGRGAIIDASEISTIPTSQK